MSTTFTWSISELERHTANGIVYTAHYRVDASNGTYAAGAYGSISFPAPEEGAEIVPYAELTPELVIDWVQDALTAENEDAVVNIEAALQGRIDEQTAPTTAKGTPW